MEWVLLVKCRDGYIHSCDYIGVDMIGSVVGYVGGVLISFPHRGDVMSPCHLPQGYSHPQF